MIATPLTDTITMPWDSRQNRGERVVPPTLAVLFRVAVGPGADHYVPRFLRFEKAGRSLLGWQWAALWIPSVWAFHRRLWLAGLVFAFLPIVGAAMFFMIQQDLSSSVVVQAACAAALVWLFPGVVAALLADSLLYARVKRLVQRARGAGPEITEVAKRLATAKPTSVWVAAILGVMSIAPIPTLIMPHLYALHQERTIRAHVAESLAAVKPMQNQVEETWDRFKVIPYTLDEAAAMMARGGRFLDSVNFNPITGRMRVALGSRFAELSGKSILLAPALDPWQRLHWICIPVDVAEKYLPLECRRK
jgi:hypothetical protein